MQPETNYPRHDSDLERRPTSRLATWLVFIALVLVLVSVFLPVFASTSAGSNRTSCLSNMKQLGLGAIFYANDYDERFPKARTWGDSIAGYVKNPRIFNEPTLKDKTDGYAFNSALGGKEFPENTPSNRALIFESSHLIWNAADPLLTLCVPPRHRTTNNFAFADGHAKAIRLDQTPRP
ncbi:MAG TPA: hypothetical protein VG944_21070 [Fimbriimonas sp.]|nr:hypothetical protein [Fimbriimonas sp.]